MLLSGVEVEVLPPVARVRARDLRGRALAGQLGLHPHLAARRAETERDPVEGAVALNYRALRAEDPRLLVECLSGHEAQVRVRPNDELDDRVEEAVLRAG